jgi:hypothetical protein
MHIVRVEHAIEARAPRAWECPLHSLAGIWLYQKTPSLAPPKTCSRARRGGAGEPALLAAVDTVKTEAANIVTVAGVVWPQQARS